MKLTCPCLNMDHSCLSQAKQDKKRSLGELQYKARSDYVQNHPAVAGKPFIDGHQQWKGKVQNLGVWARAGAAGGGLVRVVLSLFLPTSRLISSCKFPEPFTSRFET